MATAVAATKEEECNGCNSADPRRHLDDALLLCLANENLPPFDRRDDGERGGGGGGGGGESANHNNLDACNQCQHVVHWAGGARER